MSKRVTFTRKEITAEVNRNLKEGKEKAEAYKVDNGPYGAAAFEAGYYHQALITIKTFLEARYEA